MNVCEKQVAITLGNRVKWRVASRVPSPNIATASAHENDRASTKDHLFSAACTRTSRVFGDHGLAANLGCNQGLRSPNTFDLWPPDTNEVFSTA